MHSATKSTQQPGLPAAKGVSAGVLGYTALCPVVLGYKVHITERTMSEFGEHCKPRRVMTVGPFEVYKSSFQPMF